MNDRRDVMSLHVRTRESWGWEDLVNTVNIWHCQRGGDKWLTLGESGPSEFSRKFFQVTNIILFSERLCLYTILFFDYFFIQRILNFFIKEITFWINGDFELSLRSFSKSLEFITLVDLFHRVPSFFCVTSVYP